jgi:hypothetical protein
LDSVLTSQCVSAGQLGPCLCGSALTSQCLAGTTPANGPVAPLYACDLGPTVQQIQLQFSNQTTGAGMANSILECAAASGCDCFPEDDRDGGSVDAGTADVGAADVTGDVGAADAPAGDASDAATDSGSSCGLGPLTTACILASRDKPTSSATRKCSTCAQANGCLDPAQSGTSCETLTTNATLFSGALPDGKTCAQVFGSGTVSESAICIDVLSSIFASSCAATLQLTPCLCGTTDVESCLVACSATPNGPLFDQYACDNGTTSGCAISTDFTIPNGAGTANAVAECVAAFNCDCF